jgi:hypothetical protein
MGTQRDDKEGGGRRREWEAGGEKRKEEGREPSDLFSARQLSCPSVSPLPTNKSSQRREEEGRRREKRGGGRKREEGGGGRREEEDENLLTFPFSETTISAECSSPLPTNKPSREVRRIPSKKKTESPGRVP